MTKSEKKVVVNNLVNGFKSTNNSSDLKTLGNKIIQEVTECPFSHENKEVFELALQFWTQHIDNYINDLSNSIDAWVLSSSVILWM